MTMIIYICVCVCIESTVSLCPFVVVVKKGKIYVLMRASYLSSSSGSGRAVDIRESRQHV